ncbi:hypothetical protein NDI76_21655 [Halogeometricum sp. S1BR25-6]|uniref:Uncharacterized protein n=1 Tax=Halogeometricum salsisoli TaxID=2950536 RepID=A0ABU2GKK7_9EURY|nr:hypothetical protein [Halogeometricum sp. S1BR25-6]MDS0301342.1 hypothetical protein [Halogeometricum sp. S1BR25-6]
MAVEEGVVVVGLGTDIIEIRSHRRHVDLKQVDEPTYCSIRCWQDIIPCGFSGEQLTFEVKGSLKSRHEVLMGALRTMRMGLFEILFSSSTGDSVPQTQRLGRHEIFPDEEYNVAYAVAARREELRALEQLLETDQTTSTALEAEPFLQEITEEIEHDREYSLRLRTSGEELVDDIRELLEYLEVRADTEDDQFSFPESAGQVHTLVQRGLSAMKDDDNSKLAVVHKRNIPWEEPAEDN